MKFSTTFTLATLALLSIGTHARMVCNTGAEDSKISKQLQARYNDNCVQTDNSSQGDIDMEWYCIKTYGNGNIDAVTYRAYDPTGKAFVPFSWETEGGDPNSMLSTAMTYNLFQDPCNAFAEYNGDIEPPAPAPPAPVTPEKCDPKYGGQCFHLGNDFKCQNARLMGGSEPDYRCMNTKPTPAPAPPAPTKPVTCDPKNPVNPNFDCTQKVGPGSKCQTQITDMKFGVDISIYQCTKLAAGHQHRSLETANSDALGSDRDENGCIPSAGYSWCASLKECIRDDCPSSTPPSPTGAPVNPAAQPTAKPTHHHHHSSSAAALSSTKTIQQYHIAVVATLAASSIVVALVL